MAGPATTDMEFYEWVGDTAGVADVAAASTTITMPEVGAAITATYTDTYPGDLSGDGIVDIVDLNIVLIHWGWVVIPGDRSYGDANGDGYVGIIDLNSVLIDWGQGT